jgi:hypothetical protein
VDDVVSGRVTTVAELCAREKCSVRQANMTISLAFLAPKLVKAAVEGRLPHGIGVERLRDPPTEWSRQFEALSSIWNSCSASPRSRTTVAQKPKLPVPLQRTKASKRGRCRRGSREISWAFR